MKNKFSLIIVFQLITFMVSGQQWLYLPSGSTNNRIDVGNLTVAGNSITVEALVTMQSTTTEPDAYDIVSKHASDIDCNYLFRPNAFAIRTSVGFTELLNPIQLCIDSIYHLAGTYDGDSIKYYVNGSQVASMPWTGTLFENNYTTGIGNITFTQAYNEQFTGYIDEVRIWNVARSQGEIEDNMFNLPNPTSATGLLAYYNFNGDYINKQGNTLFDGIVFGAELQNTTNPNFLGNYSGFNCATVGMSEVNHSGIVRVFPNPTSFSLTVEYGKHSKNLTISIFNVLGTLVGKSIAPASNSLSTHQLDMSTLPSGVYFLTAESDQGGSISQRIIKH